MKNFAFLSKEFLGKFYKHNRMDNNNPLFRSNEEKSFHYFKLATRNRSQKAAFEIGKLLLRGNKRIESDIDEALHYLRVSVEVHPEYRLHSERVEEIFQSIEEDGM